MSAFTLTTSKLSQTIKLAIVEVKVRAITLRDFSQALGYAKVVMPDHAFIVSPNSWTEALQRLVREFQRWDILEYAHGKRIVIAKWDIASNSVRPGDTLLAGML